jgi:hypothetical protein
MASTSGCRVEAITRAEAEQIILRYEWLGTMGRASVVLRVTDLAHGGVVPVAAGLGVN